MALTQELARALRGEVLDTPEILEKMSRDASLFRVRPQVVVRPSSTADVERLVQFASSYAKAGNTISLTARSAGTDMSGGPLNSSVIVDMTEHFNHVYEVGAKTALVEPGVYFRDFDKLTREHGLELPSYTASREINTVGGMVANDSGGEKNLKYGKTARYVEELEVVLADGKSHILKNVEGEELSRKLSDPSFEGECYRKVAALLRNNRPLIEKGRPIVSKNSSGYALWDIGDGINNVNLARLFTGSQGTLGIITNIRFRLVQPEPFSSMLVIFVNDLKDLGSIVPAVLKHEPDSFESYDDHTFALAIKYFPELAAQMKTGIVRLGLSFIPEFLMLLGGIPKLVLMIEFRGATQEEAFSKAKRMRADLSVLHLHDAMHICKTAQEAAKYWSIRRESFNLLRKKVRGMRTAPFIDDFVVPPQSLPVFLPKLQHVLGRYDLTYTIAGHVGDGNFHIIPLVDPKRKELPQIIEELSREVYDLVLSFHGSISGEHNDGMIRTPWVEKMFGADMNRLFAEVKAIFDPLSIFNPGKKVGGNFESARAHFDF